MVGILTITRKEDSYERKKNQWKEYIQKTGEQKVRKESVVSTPYAQLSNHIALYLTCALIFGRPNKIRFHCSLAPTKNNCSLLRNRTHHFLNFKVLYAFQLMELCQCHSLVRFSILW